MSNKKILVVSPHADDMEMAMGMQTYAYSQQGYDVYELVLCRGELGGDPEIRTKEAHESAKVLGIKEVEVLSFPNTKFDEVRLEVKDAIEDLVQKIKPGTVYCSWPKDVNIDHVITGKEVLVAARSVPTLIYYPCPRAIDFQPNHAFYQGEEFMQKKLKAISQMQSQLGRGAVSLRHSEISGEYWANQFNHHACVHRIKESLGIEGKVYAEVFHINRSLGLFD